MNSKVKIIEEEKKKNEKKTTKSDKITNIEFNNNCQI